MKEMWKNKNFVKLWFGQLVSILGDQIHFIALLVLIQNFFGNIVVTGTVMMITALPKVLFSPFAGVLVDRWSLKKTMIISDLLRMGLVFLIPVLFSVFEKPSMMIIFILTFAISTVSVFFYPAKSASIPTLVEKEKLLAANSLSGSTQMIISLFGLLGGAVLVAVIGTTWAFIFDALTFLISAVAISLIKYPAKKPLAEQDEQASKFQQYFKEFKDGAIYIINDRLLGFMMSFFISIMLLGGAINILMLALIQDVLQLDASVIGYVFGANMVGMLIGMSLVGKITKRYPKEKLLVWSTFIFSFTISSVAILDNLVLLLPVMIINGVGNGILNVISNTIFQEHVQENMRGRVFSVIDAAVNSAAIISMLPAAWLAQQFGVTNIFLTVGVLIFLIFLISLRKASRIFTSQQQSMIA